MSLGLLRFLRYFVEGRCVNTGAKPHKRHTIPLNEVTKKTNKVLRGAYSQPNITDYRGLEYFTGVGLRATADEMGVHQLHSLQNQQSPGNASRTLRKYAAFLPCEGG